eukprot:scaffold2731_cov151-Chaetoceros_neogracile.AAC.1
MFNRINLAVALCLLQSEVSAFSVSSSFSLSHTTPLAKSNGIQLYAEPPTKPNPDANLTPVEQENLAQTFGGYTVKQRLREEVDSPFRKVRLFFFAGSTGSAMLALYFSLLSTVKAYVGGYSDAIPLDEALNNCAVNIGGAVVCGYLTYRDYQAGQENLERIARGGKLAKLAVSPGKDDDKSLLTLSDYRRTSRVLICAGGKEYIENVCKSLNSDQLNDQNNLPQLLQDVDVLVVPVLLTDSDNVGDTKSIWRDTIPSDADSNFDSTRSDAVVAFPWNNAAWADYLKSDIKTADKQGFDVLSKGITITVKKNGKILRRATGAPRWPEFVGTMEVMDGSQFGMPGDSEKYGGP